jgi:hypothetical protein
MHTMLQTLQTENADLKRRLALTAPQAFTHEPYAPTLASSSPPPLATPAPQSAPVRRPPRPLTASPSEPVDIVMQPLTPTKRTAPGQLTMTGTEISPEKSDPKRLRPTESAGLTPAVPLAPPDPGLSQSHDV